MDYGLLGGIGEGLKQAMSSYMTQTQRQQDWARQQKQDARDDQDSQLKRQAFESGLLEKGLLKDSNGNIVKNDQMQLKDKLESDDLQRQQAEATPGTPESEKAIEQAKAAYNAAQPGLGDKIATGWQTGKDARNSIYGKELISGGFGVQKAQTAADAAMERAGLGQNSKQDRMDFMAHQATIKALRSNPQLQQRVTQYQNLNNALSNIANVDVATPEAFNEAQQAIRANLGIKGSSGVGEREENYFKGLGLNWARMKEFLTTSPQDIGKDNKFLQHIQQVARNEQENIKQQMSSKLGAIAAGNKSMYARRPDLYADLMDSVQAQKDQIQPTQSPAQNTQGQAPGLLNKQPQGKYAPGTIVNVKGARYRVGADGDSLDPI